VSITYRPALPTDAPNLAKLSILAGGGTFELLVKGLKRGVSVHEVLTELCKAVDTEYSYKFFRVADAGDKIVGAINLVTKEKRYELAQNINPILQEKFKFGWWQLAKFFFRARHLKGMNILKVPPNSLHINDVAVLPEFRGKGIGKALVEQTIDQARQNGNEYVSLYVWTDNKAAISFYEKIGFIISKTGTVKPHKYLQHTGSHLMLYPTAAES